jgi:hypothetical protein
LKSGVFSIVLENEIPESSTSVNAVSCFGVVLHPVIKIKAKKIAPINLMIVQTKAKIGHHGGIL